MPFQIVRNDITNMHVDAIVNTANPLPVIGSGVDTGIHKKAGENLLLARQEIGEIAYGNAVITPAFNLNAKYVIHAVTPPWSNGTQNETTLLENCYAQALALALEHGCKSIAFPLLATGNNGFPKDIALQIAINVFSKFLMQHEMQIYLVVFGRSAVVLSEKLFTSVQSYIDENYVQQTEADEYSMEGTLNTRRRGTTLSSVKGIPLDIPIGNHRKEDIVPSADLQNNDTSQKSIDALMEELNETFAEMLLRLIDENGLTDPEVYNRVNIDRRHFSKIRKNKNYAPSKITAVAFAIALELDLDQTIALLNTAGFTLSHSNKFDVIIEFFIKNKKYDIFEINSVLFKFGQKTIGA